MENNEMNSSYGGTLKPNSIGKAGVTIMAISGAAPAMCIGGSFGLLVAQTNTGVASAAIIATIVVILIGLSYGALSEKYNNCGGTYAYISQVFGRRQGLWTAFVYFGVFISTSGAQPTIFVTYLHELLPQIPIPICFLIFVIPVVTVTWFGLELSTRALVLIWIVQMTLLIWPAIKIITMAPGGLHIDTAMENAFAPGLGISGLMLATLTWVWAYVGFEAPAYMGEELRGGAKSVKFAIPVSALAVGIIYVITCWVWTATLTPEQTAQMAGSGSFLSDYVTLIGYVAGTKWVVLSIMTSCWCCALTFYSLMPRFLYDLGRTKTLPSAYMKVNKHQIPHVGLFTYAISASIFFTYGMYGYSDNGIFQGVDDLFVVMSISASIAYAYICLGNIKDKWRDTSAKSLVFGRIVPILTIAILIYMVLSSGTKYIVFTCIWCAAALIFAFARGSNTKRKLEERL